MEPENSLETEAPERNFSCGFVDDISFIDQGAVVKGRNWNKDGTGIKNSLGTKAPGRNFRRETAEISSQYQGAVEKRRNWNKDGTGIKNSLGTKAPPEGISDGKRLKFLPNIRAL